MIQLSPEERLVLKSVFIEPSQKDLQVLEQLILQVESWDKLSSQLIDRGIAPLFYVKLASLESARLVPLKVVVKLKQAYFITLSRNIILYDAFEKMAQAMQLLDISFITLKGIYLAEMLYKDIGLRQLSDIDILVKQADAERCLKSLYELGYRSNDNKQFEFIRQEVDFIHFEPMVLNGISIEVHTRLLHKNLPYNIPPEVCFERAQKIEIHQTPVLTLELIDHIIFICLHFYKHFKNGAVQFTSISDIANLIRTELDKIDYSDLIQRCREYNCEDDVFRVFLLVDKYCSNCIPIHFVLDHKYLLTEEYEELFIRYLNGYTGKHLAVEKHLKELNKVDGTCKKWRYFLYMIFPSKAYMVRSYHIKHPKLFWAYYPYRYWVGLKGLWKIIKKRKKKE